MHVCDYVAMCLNHHILALHRLQPFKKNPPLAAYGDLDTQSLTHTVKHTVGHTQLNTQFDTQLPYTHMEARLYTRVHTQTDIDHDAVHHYIGCSSSK